MPQNALWVRLLTVFSILVPLLSLLIAGALQSAWVLGAALALLPVAWVVLIVTLLRRERDFIDSLPFDMGGYFETLVAASQDRHSSSATMEVRFKGGRPASHDEGVLTFTSSAGGVSPKMSSSGDTLTYKLSAGWGTPLGGMMRSTIEVELLPLHERHPIDSVFWFHA
jgi:hypothetical protein